ncbi:hypothetical protein HYPSUDRAFT_50777 [Hypholoma sublateritium FD-334 SS-4]|uniref:Uncharacterized protein n=1 Tax=Hypholoma sublateritium (strain FD-334 SS-4) TaxID=945553 RepID=A0A0D2MZ03_HYPSF|nr:hypothetical protein HYPSUDRAFT_50777 [Hypholoma sublateritium FD-334 SS-4]
MDAPIAYSLDELTWLKASELLDLPPTPPPKATVFIHHSESGSSSSAPSRRYAPTRPKDAPRAEWIYRRPKSPTATRPGTRPRPRPQTGYLPHRNYHAPTAASLARTISSASSTRTACAALEPQPSTSSSASSSASSTGGPFWTALLHPRARAERAVPALRTIPSTSQLSLSTPPRPKRAPPRPPSVSSSLSSTSSGSPVSTSSRSESPITPASGSPTSSPHVPHRRRPRAPLPALPEWRLGTSASCPPPARSILARTPSVSTRDSAHASAKCVTFAAAPTVHYARPGLWDADPFAFPAAVGPGAYGYAFADCETMGIDVDGMDVDADPFANYQARAVHALDPARLRGGGGGVPVRARQTPATASPPPAARGLRRLMSRARAAEPTTRVSTATFVPSSLPSPPLASGATAGAPSATAMSTSYPTQTGTQTQSSTPARPRPAISAPYALGARPSASRSAASLRSAPSMESVRSARSAAARSVRSVRSEAGAGALRAWLGRALGWGDADSEA